MIYSVEDCWLYNNCNHVMCQNEICIRKRKMAELYDKSLLSYSQRFRQALHVDVDGTDYNEFKQLSEIEKDIVNRVKRGNNLYLHSTNCGNGKTSWSIRFIQSYFNKIWPKASFDCHALFINVPTFLQELKNSFNVQNEYIDKIKDNIFKADLVVFDDIAAKSGTEFEISQLLSYIDRRLSLGKANIYTSNLGFRDLQAALGERLASRVCQASTEIELHGGDKRSLGKKAN
jgi:DNA replication protein DnaC